MPGHHFKTSFSSQLCRACIDGDIKVVIKTLKDGINVNKTDKSGNTLLMIASSEGHVDIVKLLIDARADLRCLNRDGKSALHMATVTPVLKTLVNAGADINQQTKYHGECIAQLAVQRQDIECLRYALGAGINVRLRSTHQWTALHDAALRYDQKITQLLLDYGAEVNALDMDGCIPLHVALRAGHWGNMTLFLTHGADCNIMPIKTRYGTPLYLITEQWSFSPRVIYTLLIFGYDLRKDDWYQLGQDLPDCFTEDDEIRVLLQNFQRARPTLKELCRTSIRKHLTQSAEQSSFLMRTLELPLPRTMLNFLTYEGELQDVLDMSDRKLFTHVD